MTRAEIDAFVGALAETFEENERFLGFLRAAGGRLLRQRFSSR